MIAAADIVEGAAAPVPIPNVAGVMAHSTFHRALMWWNGTLWRFDAGKPGYYSASYNNQSLAGGSLTSVVSTVAGHTLVVQAASIAVANSGFRQTAFTYEGRAGIRFRMMFKLHNTIGAPRIIRAGFLDTLDHTDATDGIYLEINGETASFKTAQGGTRTTHGTTVVLAAASYYILHIVQISATAARCVIVRESDGVIVLDVTNGANVPSGSQQFLNGYNATRGDGVAAVLIEVDEILGLNSGYHPV
jgi:hypothetical protein